MSPSGKAIFVSYASQDAEAAKRICDSLSAAGLDVWFDQSELRGGDAWDASIRARIKECALFVPIVSANTESRSEGYFRLEWKLAVDRSHLMADDRAFLLPVVIDDSPEAAARVPDVFRARQWVRLPEGRPTAEFVARVKLLLDTPRDTITRIGLATSARPAGPKSRFPKLLVIAAGAAALVLVAPIAYFIVAKAPDSVAPITHATKPEAARAIASPPASSVAVLPFANLSDDKNNEYFSEGISEELLTVLQNVSGLQVAARTSSFSFKGGNATAQEIGRKLGVNHLIEGSVRKSGKSVRITARLSRAATGEQLWSDGYTRDLNDVFEVQSELAQAIVEQLRGHLGGAIAASARADIRLQIEAAAKGGTRNPEAHQLYLQGLFNLREASHDGAVRAIGFLKRAVALDPSFALGWAALSSGGYKLGTDASNVSDYQEGVGLARRAAERAVQLEPALASAWTALAAAQMFEFDWKGASESIRRARGLAPSDAGVMGSATWLAFVLGQRERALELAQPVVSLDPLGPSVRLRLAFALNSLGRYEEAQAQFQRITELSPTSPYAHAGVALMLMRRQRLDQAAAEVAKAPVAWQRLTVQAQVLWAQGKRSESEETLKRLIATFADTSAYQIAQVYAHRRDNDRALEWLQRAARQRDSGIQLCRSDPTLATLYADPRWHAFLKTVGLADEQLK